MKYIECTKCLNPIDNVLKKLCLKCENLSEYINVDVFMEDMERSHNPKYLKEN